ncbi:MAG: sensor domain-containing diguanylate cyclase [Pelolinea sp.]|nr:sensor domain-containing diguanylate cyclase [Pelolinea sp.]
MGKLILEQKIFLIGQDRVGKTRLSTLFSQCELKDFKCIHLNSVDKSKNELIEESPRLVLVHINNVKKIEDLLDYMQENNSETPIILITYADRALSQSLIAKGVQYVIPPDHVNQISLMQCVLSALEHKRIENELRRRDEIQQAVNYAAEVFLSQLDWGARINDVLEHLGKSTRSDRAYIYKNETQEEHGLCAVLQAEWTTKGVHPLKEFLDANETDYRVFGFSRWLNVFRNGEMICGNVVDLPSEEQSHLLKMDVHTLVVVPIFADQILWGFIGFDHCSDEKNWSSAELDALKTAAKIIGAAVARQDAEMRLTHLATHDYLTNLPNRMLLEDRFELAVSRSERSGKKFGIVVIDLDKFKLVNDMYGHPFGDKVLVEVAWCLSEAVRSSDTCARVGGDEFTVLAEEIRNKKDLIRVMEKLTIALKKEILIDGKNVHITASMGASIYPNHGIEIEQLMKAADLALYQIKDTYSGYKIFIDEQYSLLNP